MAHAQLPAIKDKQKVFPRLQNFKVLKSLGEGSYGKVYKVQRASDEQSYALKETELGALSQPERNDAVNEIRLLVSINHPNVIRYHEAFLNGSKLCVVMEYAPYGDLRYYITKASRLKSPFPEEAIWRIFLQLCKGLAALHSSQIIHRDIKPANLFLCANDLLKIGDLGVAKALTRLQFTRTSIGTPIYMAPEVWAERPYSYSSDMWSVGCVLYEMMTFSAPFGGRSMADLGMRVRAGRYAPVPAGSYSAELIAFANGLLNLDPKKRPTAEQVLAHPSSARWMQVLPTPPSSLRARTSDPGMGPSSGNLPGGQHQPPHRPASLSGGSGSLIDTIVVPRDLRQLPRVLPPPCYDSDLDSATDQQQPLPQQPQQAQQRAAAGVPAAQPALRSESPARAPVQHQQQPSSAAQQAHQQEPVGVAQQAQQQAKQLPPSQRPMAQRRAASPSPSPVPMAYFPPSSPQRLRAASAAQLQHPSPPVSAMQQAGFALPRLSSPGLADGAPLLANRPPLPRLSEPGMGALGAAGAGAGARAVPPIMAHPRPRSAVLPDHRARPVVSGALPVVRASADHAPLAGLNGLSPPLVRPPARRASCF